MPEGLRRSIFIFMLICMLVIIGASHLLRMARESGRSSQGKPAPVIPQYPEAIEPTLRHNDMLDWHRLTFRVAEGYPSTSVYAYYHQTLTARGYRLAREDYVPKWLPDEIKDGQRKITYYGAWIAPNNLRVFELEISAIEKINYDTHSKRVISREIQPGLEVTCILARKVIVK